MSQKELLKVKNLKQYFPIKGGILGRTVNNVKAVDDISFTVHEGETVSVVGDLDAENLRQVELFYDWIIRQTARLNSMVSTYWI